MKASRGFQATPPQQFLLMTTSVAGRGNHIQEQSRIHPTHSLGEGRGKPGSSYGFCGEALRHLDALGQLWRREKESFLQGNAEAASLPWECEGEAMMGVPLGTQDSDQTESTSVYQ